MARGIKKGSMMKDPNILRISKWGVGIILPILLGGIAWSFQIEKRAGAIESSQGNINHTLSEMKSDIREIRNIIVEELRRNGK